MEATTLETNDTVSDLGENQVTNSLRPRDNIWQYLCVNIGSMLMPSRQQTINWPNVDFSSVRFFGIHLRVSVRASIVYNEFEISTFKITAKQLVNSVAIA